MSYLKLPKTTMDHAVGFQSINQAIDNNDALFSQFDFRHSVGVGGNSPFGFPTRALGRHDDILIARTVADFAIDTARADPVLVPYVSGPVLGALNYVRLAVGQWRIFIASAQLVGVVGLMKSTGSVDYKANCLMSYDPSTGPAVTVSTWDVASAMTVDLPFSLVIWTQTA